MYACMYECFVLFVRFGNSVGSVYLCLGYQKKMSIKHEIIDEELGSLEALNGNLQHDLPVSSAFFGLCRCWTGSAIRSICFCSNYQLTTGSGQKPS
jgi:hypothetical protein